MEERDVVRSGGTATLLLIMFNHRRIIKLIDIEGVENDLGVLPA